MGMPSHSWDDLVYHGSVTFEGAVNLQTNAFVDVKGPPYNVAGNGITTSDAAGIRAAIDAVSAAGGGVVFFPEGTYLMSSTIASGIANVNTCLLVPSNVRLVGANRDSTVLKVANSTEANGIHLTTSASDIAIENLTVDGNKANQADGGTDGDQCGIYGSSNHHARMVNVIVKNSIREGFYLSNGGWQYYSDCYAEACNRSGFEVDALQYTDILGFKAVNCTAAGIRIVGADPWPPVYGPVSVLGGQAYGCNPGLETRIARAARVVGFKATDCLGDFPDGIRVWDSTEVALIGCRTEGSGRHGIYLLDATDCQIIGNASRNNGKAQEGDGIRIAGSGGGPGNSTGNIISGNRCKDDQGSPSQLYGVREIAAGATPNNNLIVGNDLRGNGVGALLLTGAASRATDNLGQTTQTYAASNVTTDRAYDADTVVVAELADVVGTLIADLRAQGLVT